MGGAPDPWYVAAFRSDYVEVYRHRDLDSARREARYLAERGIRGRVLDLACGFGRHTLALRELGVDAFGIDLSADLLRRARELPGAEELEGRLVRADARAIPVATESLDAVVCLFSSFGYFGERGDAAVLAEVARILRGPGRVVLDLMNPERVRAALVPSSRSERDGFVLEEHRSLADGGRTVEKQVLLRRPDGTTRSWRESVRMYSSAEITALLDARGFRVERIDGDFDGAPPTAASLRAIVHARRRPGGRAGAAAIL